MREARAEGVVCGDGEPRACTKAGPSEYELDASTVHGDQETILACDESCASEAAAAPSRERSVASVLADAKEERATCRGRLRLCLTSIHFQVFILAVILLDLCEFLAEIVLEAEGLMTTRMKAELYWVNVSTLSVYFAEIFLRLIGFGPRSFCRDAWNLFDLAVVLLAALLVEGPGDLVIFARLGKVARNVKAVRSVGRVFRCLRMLNRLRPTSKAVAHKVSKNKFRYIDHENNFDLDLTYITHDLIAMGVPAAGCAAGLYRNPLQDVARFFRARHAGRFRVYNCCPELPYPERPFATAGGQVVRLRVQDHTPPTMEQFVRFLADAREWRQASGDNVLAVHCKAGKGRTGSLCCAWLLYARRCATAQQALELFAERRTDTRLAGKQSSVDTPSQVRYVKQVWQHLLRTDSWFDSPSPPAPCAAPAVVLHSLDLPAGFMQLLGRRRRLKALVQCDGLGETDLVLETPPFHPAAPSLPLEAAAVRGDVRVSVFEEREPGFSAYKAMSSAPNANRAKGIVFFFIFHTEFMAQGGELGVGLRPGERRDFRLPAPELDKVHKKAKASKTLADMAVVLKYSLSAAAPAKAAEGE